MSQEEFQKLVLEQFKNLDTKITSLDTKVSSLESELKEVKEIVLRTEEQTKSNTEFIHAIKEIAKK